MIFERRLISGEMHYPRIPHAYWRGRFRMARAMGLNAISTYVFWNYHEQRRGEYDFAGEKNVAEYVRCAQKEGLDVILRPGPYVCAEWDFGGLPAWLLEEGAAIRSADESYMRPVRAWLTRLGQELAPLQRAHGGPIVAVQLENEYGAFGSDRAYLLALRDALADAGFGASPLFTIDQPNDLAAGLLDEYPIAATFAPGDPSRGFAQLRALRVQAPLLCGEYWAGWFDHWGEPHHRLDDEQQTRDLEWMLHEGCSVNLYMFHGGTNFGFWNGANSSQEYPYQPTTTSYDYDAALDEAGRPTAKFFRFREVIAAETGQSPPAVPPIPQTIDVREFALTQSQPLLATLGETVLCERPVPMETLAQNLGYIVYCTSVSGPLDAQLVIDSVRDYAVVLVDGRVCGHLDRRLGDSRVRVRSSNARVQLDIVVENGGRINYGPDIPFERKGIASAVTLDGREVRGWRVYPLPLDDVSNVTFQGAQQRAPAFHRGTMYVQTLGDTFVDVSSLGKGALWVNGRNAGRFWNVGPQYALYVPGSWLRTGANDVVALDLFPHQEPPRLRGVRDPIVR